MVLFPPTLIRRDVSESSDPHWEFRTIGSVTDCLHGEDFRSRIKAECAADRSPYRARDGFASASPSMSDWNWGWAARSSSKVPCPETTPSSRKKMVSQFFTVVSL